jgi:hypothetical protein
MGPGLILTGLAAALTFVFVMAVDRHKRPAVLGASAFMLLTWCVAVIASVFGEPPDSMLWGQVCDGFLVVFLLGSMRYERARWKIGVLSLLAIQAVVNFTYQVVWQHPAAFNTHVLILNLTFFAQLACVLSPGVRDVVKALNQRRALLGSHRGPSELV